MKGRARGVVAALALAILVAPGLARADDAKQEAQRLFTQGNALFGDGDYVAALERFDAAYAKFPSPKILLNRGTTLRLLGRNVEAAALYEKYLAEHDADAAKVPEVRRALTEIDAILAHLKVTASEADAAIRLDGRVVEGASASFRVAPGPHELVAERAGFAPAVSSVTLAAGEHREIELRLQRPGERLVVRAAPPTPGATQRAFGYTAGGLGVAALGTGLVLALVARAKAGDAKDACRPSDHFTGAFVCGADGESGFATADGLKTAATVTSIAGAVVLASGVVLVLTAPRASAGATPSPKVGVGPRGAFVAFSF